MRNAVKLGKLEGDQLLGGPEDSDDDLKEVMDIIKQGEVENARPNLLGRSLSLAKDQEASSFPEPKVRNKTSRFKVNRGGALQSAEQTVEDSPALSVEPPTPVASKVTELQGSLRLEPTRQTRSPSPVPDTPLTIVERSSPKLPLEDLPVVTESVLFTPVSRKSPSSSQSTASTVRELASVSEIVRERTPTSLKTPLPAATGSPPSTLVPSTITDSPSFAPSYGYDAVFPSMIVDSPSFVPPQGAVSMPPMIVDSPDFPPPPSAKNPVNPAAPPLVIDSPSFSAGPKNPGPPRVMSSRVIERSLGGASQRRVDVPGKKVSRFAAERG